MTPCITVWLEGQQPRQDTGVHWREVGRFHRRFHHRRHKCVAHPSKSVISSTHCCFITDPATNEILGTIPELGLAETKEAISVAEKAFKTWSKTTVKVCISVPSNGVDTVQSLLAPTRPSHETLCSHARKFRGSNSDTCTYLFAFSYSSNHTDCMQTLENGKTLAEAKVGSDRETPSFSVQR